MRELVLGEERTVEEKTERGVVDELGVGVGEEEVEAVGEALLDFDLAGVVVGFAGVVAVDGDVDEARVGLEKLGVGGVLAADGAGDGELAVVGIGTEVRSEVPWESCAAVSWLKLESGMPTWTMCEPT